MQWDFANSCDLQMQIVIEKINYPYFQILFEWISAGIFTFISLFNLIDKRTIHES